MNQVTMLLQGGQQLARALKLTNENTRVRTRNAVKHGTEAVVAGAAERVHRVSGELASTIRAEYSKDGMIGKAKVGYGTLLRRSRSNSAKRIERLRLRRENSRLQAALATTSKQAQGALDLGVYAPVVERGDPKRHHAAHPFLIPSFTQAKPAIIAEMREAVNGAIPAEMRS